MDRDTFSHIRLWCPRPFGTYSQNKARSPGSGGNSGGASGAGSPSVCKAELSQGARRTPEESEDVGMIVGGREGKEEEEDVGSENTPPEPELESGAITQTQAPQPPPAPPSPPTTGSQMQDGRVLLDTWYVIKPGNTKEKIAFFVAHQLSGAGQPRPSAMKVKGNWATDCSKAKRRRRCSSYDPPTRSQAPTPDTSIRPPSPDELPLGVNETDLLSVAEMVALVEQRTAMALQGIVAVHSNQHHHQSLTTTHSQGFPPNQHTLLQGTVSDPSPMLFESNGSDSQAASESQKPSSPIQTDQEFEEEQESYRVAQAIAHFESQTLENRLHLGSGSGVPSNNQNGDGELRRGDTVTPPPPPNHTHGEVRIAFRVSNMDPRSQLEPAGRSRCMFMSCGGGSNQAAARAKEKITCDLYQLVSPSSRDPSSLLLAATASTPKPDGDLHQDNPSCGTPDPNQELSTGEKKGGVGRERVTGFHVEVVVTGAVDQCVFYGKDSTENVQEETVCFAMPTAGGGGGGVGSSTDPSSDDPPPGQLFFLQSPRGPEDDITAKTSGSGAGMCSLDCANNNSPGTGVTVGSVERATRPDSPGVREDCSDPSLCRLYRHVSHDFLEIRFQIQRLLEPRQYMLLLPDHIMVNIFSYLPTRSLAALKCTCHYFKALIETYGVHAVDSRWNQDPLYRDDPCKQCKRQYERGDVSLCRWHPKPYHHDLPYGRSYWMCCRRTDKDTPGCRVGLHDNNWVQQPADGSQPIRTKREERREEAR
ncbi:F-box only protein 46-like [Poecilia formosa]|uniref:F-box only protein 46-like n=1 Tax=Poecilia formosa TaxID=48698 RepID=UPI00044404EB|nr:PREDICTED: F-box only protein 46-like [Poecilia formosa]XP_007577889.1 PREDICTED: F-box only protein 46-like [Poecilia formosa]XP_016518355.1 PREDICTED: F-box only protein 46-like [Poecilia formosa]